MYMVENYEIDEDIHTLFLMFLMFLSYTVCFFKLLQASKKFSVYFIKNNLLISELTQLKPEVKGQLHMPFF